MDTNTTNKTDAVERQRVFEIFSCMPAKPLESSRDMELRREHLLKFLDVNSVNLFCQRFRVAREFLEESLSGEEVEKYLPGQMWFDKMEYIVDRHDLRSFLKESLDEISSIFETPIKAFFHGEDGEKIVIKADPFAAANMIERKFHKKETNFSCVLSWTDWIEENFGRIDALMKPMEGLLIELVSAINRALNTDFILLKDMKNRLCWSIEQKKNISLKTLFDGIAE